MTTNTAAISPPTPSFAMPPERSDLQHQARGTAGRCRFSPAQQQRGDRPLGSLPRWRAVAGSRNPWLGIGFGLALWLSLVGVQASTVLGPWVPIFKGVDHMLATNTPGGGGFARLQVVNAIRVDLTDPDVQLFATPRISNWQPNSRETAGRTVKRFLAVYKLQVAINANYFDPQQYYLAEGTAMEAYGVLISQGTVVSSQEGLGHDEAVMFRTNNDAFIVHTNWPAASNAGIYTAISGEYPLLVAGVNVGYQYQNSSEFIHQVNPRTAVGLSQDRHTLYLMTLDGRQPGYSDGSLDWETAAWLIKLGAYDAVNMDGGGSTTLVMADSVGQPVELNKSSAVADSGNERTVGAHFGIYAKPVPAFINDVTVTPDDTSAKVTWSTIAAATTQVDYGLTTDLGSSTALDTNLATNHEAVITGLTPETTYYFAVASTAGTNAQQSPLLTFTTTNYVTTNLVFDVTNAWRYSTANLDSVNWTNPTYDDSAWGGPGPALLWIDVRQGGPDPLVQPKNTQLPGNPANSNYPFITYYFRTHFSYTNSAHPFSLQFSAFIDDGAIFYLNGQEVYRLNLPAAPSPIGNSTLANAYTYADATNSIPFAVLGDLLTNLVTGDNVLAVEVHNYNALSPDITFGTSLTYTQPYAVATELNFSATGGTLTLDWSRLGFTLQQADAVSGPWSDVPGPVVSGPFKTNPSAAARYFRLRR